MKSFCCYLYVAFICSFFYSVSSAQSLIKQAPVEWEHPSSKQELIDYYDAEKEAQSRRDREITINSVQGEDGAYAFHDSDSVYHEIAFVMGESLVYRKTNNLTVSRKIGVVQARDRYAVDGRSVRIGMWDMGRVFKHAEFSNRLEEGSEDTPSGYSNHATHVAGTLSASGIDSEAIGMAPGASLVSYTWDFDYLEMYKEAQRGLRVSNHSYGYEAGWERFETEVGPAWNYDTFSDSWTFGEYVQPSYYWDSVMELNPYYLVVKAAGNEAGQGPGERGVLHYHNRDTSIPHYDIHETDCEDGYGCLGPAASVKNGLVVGALQSDGETLVDFSSRGPTLDGRIKPDLVSIGESVYSTLNETAYGISTGTSMATPTVAGSVALLLDLERKYYGDQPYFLASTLKAILLHTADDLGREGPDYQFGWGRIDIEEAIELIHRNRHTTERVIQQPVIVDDVSMEYYSSGGPVKVTLTWTDPVGNHPNLIRDKTKPVLVEDLDVMIEQNGREYFPYVLDPSHRERPAETGINTRDNVEQVVVPFLPAGPFTVHISRKVAGESMMASLVVTGSEAATATAVNRTGVLAGNEVEVYPNPVRRGHSVYVRLSLSSAEPVQIVVYDAAGREVEIVFEGPAMSTTTTYPISADWAPGVYYVRIRGSGFLQTESFIVY